MTGREWVVAAVLIGVGCAQMFGDVLGIPALKGLAAATGASPAPKVFTAQNGYETHANRFFLEWQDAAGSQQVLELTPEVYANLRGPYNRRNVYGAVISYAPVLEANPVTRPMFRSMLTRTFCGASSVLTEIGVPADARPPLRIRLEPRRPAETQDFALVHEVVCND